MYQDLFMDTNILTLWPLGVREKGRDLTQSYDKSPYPLEKSKKQRDNTENATKTSITQQLRTD